MTTYPPNGTLWDAFSTVPDHRSRQGRRYPLPALLTLATAAMLCGRQTLTGIAWWARTLKRSDLAALGIREARAPCPATWCVFFQSLRVNAGEILQRLAGVKVQHGRKQEGPDIGAFLLVSFHS
jgi:hypothetical protein